MFNKFMQYFKENMEVEYSKDLYCDFIHQLGGRVYGEGLFNSFSANNVNRWTDIVSEAYPEFKNSFELFGYDWLGRCFGIDLRRETRGNILMFEIGTDDVLEIPCQFIQFLNEEIPLYTEECLAKSFFEEWREYCGRALKYGRCAGYKIPLFLGGEDDISNLEDSDMEVYWDIITQIKKKI